ncbi:MAG: ABC transporter permease [Spiribacter salinus]|uniref:ABC transporter permease n=1 Tax=Spiribacter salinus TaxID=1335746 RepID=A0A540VRF3_9GAMM|nr:MAG: ABC transporter permease [Spiribacter salinus]
MNRNPFLLRLLSPGCVIALALAAALVAILQYSFRTYVPGSLEVGGFTLENFARLSNPSYAWVFVDTLWTGVLTAAVTLLLGYPLAYAMVRKGGSTTKAVMLVLAITPLFTGDIVRTYAWLTMLGNSGFVNSMLMGIGLIDQPLQLMYTKFGVLLALVQYSMPIMVIILAAAISHIDRNYEKAATSLGANPLRVFCGVTLPLSMPGIVSGCLTIFAWTLSAFATPQLIGGGNVMMVSNLVYQIGFSAFNFPFAAVLCLAALVLSLTLMLTMRRVSGGAGGMH